MPADTARLTATELNTADALGTQLIGFVRLLGKAKARLSSMVPGSEKGAAHGAVPIVSALVRGGPQRASTLSESLHTEISTISRQTSALVQLGLIERQADPADGRACLLAPTEQGRALYERARAERNAWLAETVREWPPDDVERLIGLLDRLNTDIANNLDHAQSKGDDA